VPELRQIGTDWNEIGGAPGNGKDGRGKVGVEENVRPSFCGGVCQRLAVNNGFKVSKTGDMR